MKPKQIIAKLDGTVVGSETINVCENFAEMVSDTRFTETEKFSCFNYGFMVWRQRLLRDGGLSPEEKKITRENRARNKLAEELGYENFEEMKEDVRAMKRSRINSIDLDNIKESGSVRY